MKQKGTKISLAPLTFVEVVADILKIKPEPKQPKKKPTAKKRAKAHSVDGRSTV